ncbi:MAG: peptide/nickel transport system substrate-binding protein, partial [Gaiellaceae bacterium]|nr:peptide/nickel transport system substrate-binding protein [Gaiellaceae bacterium]
MTRKLWLSTALVAVALLAVFAGSGAAKSARAGAQGGTMNIDLPNDVDYTDPALDYLSTGWEIEYATCLKLMNYPDANGAKGSQLVPEAATGFPKVSNNGKTYDFNVKVGYTKFSNGQAVTAANFKAAFDRNADPKMQSPAVAFFSDIVGSGKSPVSGVKVSGSHLIINLTHASPDFLARVAMPFFCAIPTKLSHDPNGVLAPASAGPYYISDRVPNKSITLKKNPYYKGKRPHNVSEIDYTIGNSLSATYLRVQQGSTDYAAAGIPPASYSEAASKYGINKGQFWVKPQLGTQYLAMNHDRPEFQGANGSFLAKAINYAVDRKAMLAQGGYLAGKRTDQILPPGIAGFRDASLYPLKGPDLATAKKWAAKAGLKDGTPLQYYTSNTGSAPLVAQIVQFDLKQIGLNVNSHLFARAVQIDKEGTRGEPFDITSEGWIADYADPYDFINVLLDGGNLHASNNNNVAYFNDPTFNKAMSAASLLSGSPRYSAYGNLDVKMMNSNPPWAP